MATAEELATAFVSDGHKYGWRFAKVWGEQNPKGNPVAHTMLFSQLKFKAEIEGKEYVLGGQAVYETNSSQISSILPVGNQARAGSQQLLFVLFYDPDAPDSPAYTNAGRVSPSSNVITLQEHQFLVRLTVSTQSATRAEYTTVVDQSIAHIFCTDRSGSNLGNNKYSKWWIDGGTLDDDGWDFCFEFSQDTPANIKSFSVCLETNYPLPPTEEARISEANGLYLYMDDHAELQVGGGCADSSLPHYLDPASIKTIDLAADLPQLELRYKDTDGTVYELKGGAKVDTSNLVTLDTAQTVEGAKTFSEPVTLEAEGTADSHAVTKSYVDSKIEAVASSSEQGLAGVAKLAATQTFTGANTFSGATNFTAAVTAKDPVNATELATKQYVDAKATEAAGDQANLVTLDGAQTITGAKTFGVAPVISAAPTEANHAATKAYVDTLAVTGSNPNIYTVPQILTLLASITGYNQRHYLQDIRIYTKENLRITFKYLPAVCEGTKSFIGVVDGVGSGRAEAKEDAFFKTYELQPGEFEGTVTFYPDVSGADATLASLGIELFAKEDALYIHAIPPAGGSGSYKENVGLMRFSFEAPYIDRISMVISGNAYSPDGMEAPTQLRAPRDVSISYACDGYAYPAATYTSAKTPSVLFRPSSDGSNSLTPRFTISPSALNGGFGITPLKPQTKYLGPNGANKFYGATLALKNLKIVTTGGPLYLKYYQTTLSYSGNLENPKTGYFILSLDPCSPEGKAESFFESYTLDSREVKGNWARAWQGIQSGSNLGQLFFNSTDNAPCVIGIRTSRGDISELSDETLSFSISVSLQTLGVQFLSASAEIVHDAEHPEWEPQKGYSVATFNGAGIGNGLPSDNPDHDAHQSYSYDYNNRAKHTFKFPTDTTFVESHWAISSAWLDYLASQNNRVLYDVPSSALVSTFSPQYIGGQKTFFYPPRAILQPQVDSDCANKYYVDTKIAELEARIAALEGGA